MEMSGLMGSFLRVTEWLMAFFVANLMWLLFNFPILYLLLSMLDVGSVGEVSLHISIVIVLIPITFFPATTALFGVIRRWIDAKNNDRIMYHFWKYYKENFLRSLIGGIFFVALWVLWIVNYNLSGAEIGSGMYYFYIAMTLFLLAFTNYFFADAVHFKLNIFRSIKKVLLVVIFQVHYTLGAAAAVGISIYIIYQIHPLFLFLFFGPLIAYIYFFAYHQIFLRAQEAATTEAVN